MPIIQRFNHRRQNLIAEIHAGSGFQAPFPIQVEHVHRRYLAKLDVRVRDRLRRFAVRVHDEQQIFWAAACDGSRSGKRKRQPRYKSNEQAEGIRAAVKDCGTFAGVHNWRQSTNQYGLATCGRMFWLYVESDSTATHTLLLSIK